MKRACTAFALAIMASGAVAAQGRGTAPVTSPESIAADKMKFEAETLAGHRGPQGIMMSGAAVKGAPFTAQEITEITGTLRDATHISRTTSVAVARDSEGRTRRETEAAITIVDPVANVSYRLIKRTHTAVKLDIMKVKVQLDGEFSLMADSDRDAMKQKINAEFKARGSDELSGPVGMTIRRGPAPERVVEDLGAQVLEGVSAIGKRTTLTFPVSPEMGNDQPIKSVEEHWFSPELQMDIMSHRDNPQQVTQSTERFTNIKRGDPGAALFQVPANYIVVTKTTKR